MMVSLLHCLVSCNGEIHSKCVYDMHSVSYTQSIDSKYLNKEGMTLLKAVKKWFKPKFEKGGPPCLKGLARTLPNGALLVHVC